MISKKKIHQILFPKCLKIIKLIVLFLISLFPSLILFIFNIQVLKVNQQRIGHLCLDIDSFLKDCILKKSKKKYILIKEKNNANSYIFQYFSQYLILIDSNFASAILKIFFSNNLFVVNLSKKYSEGTHSLLMYKIVAKWGRKKPLFHLSKENINNGNQFMKKKGLNTKKFIVCFHSRTSIFSGNKAKDFGQSFRNFSAVSFHKAINYVIKKGGLAIRLGDKDNIKIKIKNKNYFDYANCNEKENSLDIFFCATAKFFLGNTSGLFGLSAIFGTPVACCNMIPITTCRVYSYKDTSIPAMYKKKGKYLSFKEIFNSNFRNAQDNKIFDKMKKKIKIIPNSADDIKELVAEKLDEINNNLKISEKDINNQMIFNKNFKFGDSRYYSKSKVGYYFLRKYNKLL